MFHSMNISAIDEPLSCLQILTVMTKTATNILVEIVLCIYASSLLEKHFRVELLGDKVDVYSVL